MRSSRVWTKDKKPLSNWIEDHRLRLELHFNSKDIGDMDEEERIFHLSIFHVLDVQREKLERKRKKEAQKLKAKSRRRRFRRR